jgi:hypothetical protein
MSPNRRIPSNTFKKKIATMMMPDAFQEGRVVRAGVTALVSAEPTRISPDPKKPQPRPYLWPTNMCYHDLAVTIVVSPWQTLRGWPDREQTVVDKGWQ